MASSVMLSGPMAKSFTRPRRSQGRESSRRNLITCAAPEEMTTGFRYDTTLQRWVRDPRATNSVTKITTMTGEEYTAWPVCYSYLEQKGLKSYDVEDVYAMVQKRKAVILDIRPEDEFERGHAEGALNAPLFRLAQTQSRGMMLKKVAFALLAMKPRERNPTFLEDAERALGGKNKPFFIMCGTGGTMDQIIEGNKMGPNGPYKKKFNDPDRSFGRESRSLKAAYELYKAGFKNIMHVKGGFGEWRFRDLPVVD